MLARLKNLQEEADRELQVCLGWPWAGQVARPRGLRAGVAGRCWLGGAWAGCPLLRSCIAHCVARR